MADELKDKDVDTGAEGTGDESAAGAEEKGKDENKKGSEKTFTQEEVNRMMAREKKQGRNSLLKELGFKDEESAKSASKSYAAYLESQKTEEEKAAEESAANDAALKEAQTRAELSEAKVEAMMLGCQPKYVDDVITLAVAKLTDDSDLKTIIGELKQKYPTWFGEALDEGDKGGKDGKDEKPGQKGTGGSVSGTKDKESGKDGQKSLGSRLAASKRTNRTGDKKASYWN